MTDRIYAIYKRKPYTKGDWYQVDDREFTDYKECKKEADKVNAAALIKRVKTEDGRWVNIII